MPATLRNRVFDSRPAAASISCLILCCAIRLSAQTGSSSAPNSLKDATEQVDRGDCGTARPWLHEQAHNAWAAADSETLAVVYLLFGRCSEADGDDSGALQNYQNSRNLFHALGARSREAAALSYIGGAYQKLSDLAKALQASQEALNLRRGIGDSLGEAHALSNLGALLMFEGQYQEALSYFQQALVVFRGIHKEDTNGEIYYSIGMAYGSLGLRSQALESLERALEIQQRTGDQAGQAATLNGEGLFFLDVGEYEQAVNAFRHGLRLQPSSSLLVDIALAYESMGDDERALQYLRSALDFQHRYQLPQEPLTLSTFGSLLRKRGENQESLSAEQHALDLMRHWHNRLGEGQVLNELGLTYLSLRQSRHALECLRQSLVIARELRNGNDEATARESLGEVHVQAREYVAALGEFGQALQLRRHRGQVSLEADDLTRIASAQRELHHFPEAIQNLHLAIHSTEYMRAKLHSYSSRATFLATKLEAPRQMASILAELAARPSAAPPFTLQSLGHDYAETAFYFAELTKARSLTEMLAQKWGSRLVQGLPPALATRETALLDAQAAILKATAQPGRDPEAGREQWERNRTDLDQFIRQLRNDADPKVRSYAALKYPAPVRVSDVHLLSNEVLLEYLVLPREVLLWRIGSDKQAVRLYHIPIPRDDLRKDIEQITSLLRQTSAVRGVKAAAGQERPAGQQLQGLLERAYRNLIAPALSGVEPGKHLTIVPDDVLFLTPFEAFGHNTRQGWQYLGDEYPVTYSPSATVLNTAHSVRFGRHGSRALLAFGDPKYQALSGDDRAPAPSPSERTGEFAKAGYVFRSLPATRSEVLGIGKLFGLDSTSQDLKLGASASKSTLQELSGTGALTDYRYLHIAAHGVLATEIPGVHEPALVLAQNGDSADDGFLTMSDIFKLQLNADLVVLSACQTGLGGQVEGEGVIGMVRALMYAGSSSVVVSLWSVNDESTASLMQSFYTHLVNGRLDKATALQLARSESRAANAAPFYWAPFVLYGER